MTAEGDVLVDMTAWEQTLQSEGICHTLANRKEQMYSDFTAVMVLHSVLHW